MCFKQTPIQCRKVRLDTTFLLEMCNLWTLTTCLLGIVHTVQNLAAAYKLLNKLTCVLDVDGKLSPVNLKLAPEKNVNKWTWTYKCSTFRYNYLKTHKNMNFSPLKLTLE